MNASIARRLLLLLLLIAPSIGGSCEPGPPPPPPPDPWKEKIAALRREYESNDEKLKADWTLVLQEATSNELNADRLLARTLELQQSLQDSERQLEQWNAEVAAELRRRGQQPE